MSSPQIISSIIGLLIGGTIFWLVRRDHLVSRDGIRWLLLAILIVTYGLFPGVNDWLGNVLGIGYPPIIPVLIALGVVLIKLLAADIQRAQMKVDIDRLVQKIAILEHQLEQNRTDSADVATKKQMELNDIND